MMLKFDVDSHEDALARKAEAYLHETFGATVDLTPISVQALPQYVSDLYVLWRADLLGTACIFMAPRRRNDAIPDQMGRHADVVRQHTQAPLVVLLFDSVSPARRHVLLKLRIAFLAPGSQLFVPEALLDLRERTPRSKPQEPDALSPTAQVAVLGELLNDNLAGMSATDLARRYGVAIMSMTRAFDELEAADLAVTDFNGRRRVLQFKAQGRKLWERAAPKLGSPVRKVRTVIITFPDHFPAYVAGESALSRLTDLAPPRLPRVAVAASNWNQLERDHGLNATYPRNPQAEEVETWSYDPGALARVPGGAVDPLSLHLSLRGEADERVAYAADQLLETMPWW